MDACDVLTSLLLHRVPQSDDWQPARLGVLDAIIHSRTKGRTFATCNYAKTATPGQSGIQASHLECHRKHHCGGGTCPSAACARVKTDVPFLSQAVHPNGATDGPIEP